MGVARAKAYHLSIPDLSFDETTIQDPAEEVKRFDAALEQSISELEKIRTHTKENIDAEHAEIFSAHILVLGDPELINPIKEKRSEERRVGKESRDRK